MPEISRAALFGRLNPSTLKSLENATTFAKLRGNPYVELVHWLHQLMQDQTNDFAAIRRKFGVDDGRLAQDVVDQLNQLPRGATAIQDFSPLIEDLAERAWMYASLGFNAARIRSGHLFLAALKAPNLRNALSGLSAEFRKIKADQLSDEFAACVAGSAETDVAAASAAPGGEGDAGGEGGLPAGEGKALARFSIDLTEKARKGEIETVVGRDREIRQMVDILLRRRQNNPILTGEAGVGKTAVVEGFAKRIVDGDVPPSMRNVTLRVLDIGLLQAGASMRGEFEKRLRSVIDEVEGSEKPVILFIDEIHTLVGAGGQAGTGDAANLLKPALARGRLRTIGATTWAEYRKYIEKDPALTRRFQVVKVEEPDAPVAISMIRNAARGIGKHHGVTVLDEAIEASVLLSQRYVPARQLPDKAVSLLDTACARVSVSQHATPALVEDAKRRIELLDMEIEIAARERDTGYADATRSAELAKKRQEAEAELKAREARWTAEKAAIAKVSAAREALAAKRQETGADDAAEIAALDAALAECASLQGDAPLVFPAVDRDAVAAIVAEWTGVPVGRMVKDEIKSVLSIADRLKTRVIGQDHAMDAIAKRIQTSRAKLDNPQKPIGVFMLCGPSGVGKTETAYALAELMYGGSDALITINMSEFQEAHTVSTLKGAPPGYVGYGEGGVLTEAVRRRPYSVVLLDEVEKAHSDVHEIFFQAFDKGFMEDGEGRFIDFKNALILLTSNVGTDIIASACADDETKPDAEALAKALRPEQLKVFPPALLGRLITLPYYPLSHEMLGRIVRLQLGRIQKRIAENHGIEFSYGQDVVDHIVGRCTEMESGGRMIDAILTNGMLPQLSVELLKRQMEGAPPKTIAARIDGHHMVYDYA